MLFYGDMPSGRVGALEVKKHEQDLRDLSAARFDANGMGQFGSEGHRHEYHGLS
jgi:hypothetical protein